MMAILVELTFYTSFKYVRWQRCMLTCLSSNITSPKISDDSGQNGRYNVLPAVSKYTDTGLLYISATHWIQSKELSQQLGEGFFQNRYVSFYLQMSIYFSIHFKR